MQKTSALVKLEAKETANVQMNVHEYLAVLPLTQALEAVLGFLEAQDLSKTDAKVVTGFSDRVGRMAWHKL